ncbi:MAG: formylglycine-generating enzyme family protein [Prosthecobacter sp.]|uniref:formylglycine-generating enzyme family protein n=1 Tax=Prosthecobacter sp. TaxID=1965333 RepID=UPI003901DED8
MRPFKPSQAALLFCLSACFVASAQNVSPTGGDEPAKPHVSTLGARFVIVPGITVQVAARETRLSEWNEFLRQKKHPWSYQAHFEQTPEHPVVGVNLQDAVAFCNWLTETEREKQLINSSQAYRLPTPDEWDAAVGLARGRKKVALTAEDRMLDDRIYPWGQEWPPPSKTANFADGEIPGYSDGYAYTAPVGSFAPSAEGIYDLAGNVWEWTQPMEIRAQPNGILRGGSWAYFRAECLTSGYQYAVPVDLRAPTTGFRCVFEDKRRTASLLAATDAEQKRELEDRMKTMAESRKVDTAAIEEVRKKMQSKGGDDTLPDPASLKPAIADGGTFLNALGMRFVPLQEKGGPLICATETRVRDYEIWLHDTGRTWSKKPSFLLGGSHPAAGVSWEDAAAFCAWLTERDRASKLIPTTAAYRLPRDLEWSLAVGLKNEQGADPAARHLGDKTHYPWTPKADDWKPPALAANLDATKIPGTADSYSYTAPVDSARPNALGLFELGGNVSEWCEDTWPGAPEERVIRGGSWLAYDKDALLTSARSHALKNSTRADLGFRCVLDFQVP